MYEFTANDLNYPDDVRAMIMAPLNAESSSSSAMLGIIFVNSRKPGVFKGKHVDALGFISDTVAACICNTIHLFELQDKYDQAQKKLRQSSARNPVTS